MYQPGQEYINVAAKGQKLKNYSFERENVKRRVSRTLTTEHDVNGILLTRTMPNGLTVGKFNKNIYFVSDQNTSNHVFFNEDFYTKIDKANVCHMTAVARFLAMLKMVPVPRLSLTTACLHFILAIFILPRPFAEKIIFPAFRLSFGTLYPAYASYKAVRTKNVKEYVKWMMYWIVYAFFTCTETITDIFLSWFPFYYEVKVVIVLWLLSPATKGSSTLYRKFVHPMLTRREQEIDEYLNQAKERGYSAVLQLGSKGVNYATNVIMQTAIKGGGNLVQTIRRSYSLSDLSEPDIHRTEDEVDDVVTMRPHQRLIRQRLNTQGARSVVGTRHSTGMYFTEVDVGAKEAGDFNYNVRSSDDISSGYSSAEPISGGLSRTSSMSNASKSRLKAKRSEVALIALEDLRCEFELSDCELSENEDDYIQRGNFPTSQQYVDTQMDRTFDDRFYAMITKDIKQCEEDFFDTKSTASCEIPLNCNNLHDNDDDNQNMNKKCNLDVNTNEMLTSLKDDNNKIHKNDSDRNNNHRPYVHKKGIAPQPPSKQKLEISSAQGTDSTTNLKETEICMYN